MSELKTECAKCGASILQSTASENDGRCKPCAVGPNLENTAEGMEVGMRLLLGVIFGVLFGGLGYAIGSFLGTIGAVIVTVPFALAGFVYGCFCVELNAVIRSILPHILDP